MIAKTNEFPKIRACLFDMDGLLLDTEDIYTHCNNIILQEYGRPNLPWKIKAQLQGRPAPESSAIFHAWAQLPVPRGEFAAKQSALQATFFPTARPLPGTALLLKTLLTTSPRTHLALATSSHAANFRLKTSHQEPFFAAFPPHRRILGDDPRIPKGQGKPAPDIYLLALETINADLRARRAAAVAAGHSEEDLEEEIQPEECLVFEDSVPGVEAGRRAGMRVVWCPHPELLKEYRGREEEVLAGTAHGFLGVSDDDEEEVDDKEGGIQSNGNGHGHGLGKGSKASEALQRCNKKRAIVGKRGPPGVIGDGWAELRATLEDFPYAKYGINV